MQIKLKSAFNHVLYKNNTLSYLKAYLIGLYDNKDSFLFENLTKDDKEIQNNHIYTMPML